MMKVLVRNNEFIKNVTVRCDTIETASLCRRHHTIFEVCSSSLDRAVFPFHNLNDLVEKHVIFNVYFSLSGGFHSFEYWFGLTLVSPRLMPL
jgi:hypothetical protein